MAGRYWIEQLARVPAVVEIGSEVRYRQPVFSPEDLVVAVSQSGETIDTLAALKAAQAQGARTLAVSNVMDSAIPRASDASFYTRSGPEIGVASTKCFTTQLVSMLLLAVALGRERDALPASEARRVLGALIRVPGQLREVLARESEVRRIARDHVRATHMLFLGRGTQYPVALEGALKVKEISYIHAEGYAAGEMKHGPIALIDPTLPVVALCPRDANYEKTFSNLQEVKARDARIVAVGTDGDQELAALVASQAEGATVISVPRAEPEVLPFLTAVPLQLFAYHLADLRGTDVDQPRNLAKTVTVE
jgi:glucosamine--fructose-6-phosphate aminotransferase (isomerizing)